MTSSPPFASTSRMSRARRTSRSCRMGSKRSTKADGRAISNGGRSPSSRGTERHRRGACGRNLLRVAFHPLSLGQRRAAAQRCGTRVDGGRREPRARARLPLRLGRHVQLPGPAASTAKLGYQVFGELDYPPGHKRIFLQKRLERRLAHKFTRTNDFSGLSALSRNFFVSASSQPQAYSLRRRVKAPAAGAEGADRAQTFVKWLQMCASLTAWRARRHG